MEFQCRLGTEHGQVVEGVYVADDEAGLRRELEGKGYFILAARPKGALALPGLPALPTLRRRRVSGQELLLFNQELATLLKAGMPLAQSLDILRQKVPNPTFKSALDDVFDKVRSGIALSDAQFQSVSTAGWDAARQADGSLPALPYLRLAATSTLIDKGVDVGLPYLGAAPDLGAFEQR